MSTQTLPQSAAFIPLAPANLRELCIQDEDGDTKIHWDARKPEEVATAKQSFETLRKKGYMAYKIDARGDKGEVIREFDPNAEKIILAQQMQGG